jgi:hypothetical protein
MKRWVLIVLVVFAAAMMVMYGDMIQSEETEFQHISGLNKSTYCANANSTQPETLFIKNRYHEEVNYSLTLSTNYYNSTMKDDLQKTFNGTLSPGEYDRITYLDSEIVRQYEDILPSSWDVDFSYSAEGELTIKRSGSFYQRNTQNGEIFYFYDSTSGGGVIVTGEQIYCLTRYEPS